MITARLPPFLVSQLSRHGRTMANLNRPSPPSLPREQQQLLKPEFEGNINPKTGEKGGPKREPPSCILTRSECNWLIS
ncbi:hypothetical protein Agabi119p4_1976 [Agaricus bisporus var. burnettii]|uniref:Uncharacterized protein n=1 Tax=Agaricus bisporus var. burnettii TaxID=192524 RepID=A0A8H7F883_AGABI|nr:hypothetical protein Agabi119p4_1976 [Agaricus bisporus var. burnettii]